MATLIRYWTRLSLAGVVAIALLALGITLISSPAWAPPKPSLKKLTCTTDGEIPKWNGTTSMWECAPDEDTDTPTLSR